MRGILAPFRLPPAIDLRWTAPESGYNTRAPRTDITPLKELQSSFREVAVIQEATEMILSSMDADTVLHQILLIVRNYFGVSKCAVFLVDASAGELYCRAQNGYETAQTDSLRLRIGKDPSQAQGVIGYVAHMKIPLYVPDTSKEPRHIVSDPSIRSELSLPLVVREEVIGVLNLESDKLDYFTDEMIGLLAVFAGQAAVALENARLYSTERRRMRQIEFINLIARSATSAHDLDQLLGTLSDLVGDTFEHSEVSIALRDPSGNMVLGAHSGSEPPSTTALMDSIRSGIISDAIAARMNVVVNDVNQRRKESQQWRPCFPGSGSELCIPLLSLGETLGVIIISQQRTNAFAPEDRSIAQAAGDVCATAIRNVQLSEELRRVANTDSLTGIYNQRYFHMAVGQEISRSRRFSKEFAVLMFDIHDFRLVNESTGFDNGDQVLRTLSHALTASVRTIDTLCRYNGDCFAVILPEIESEQIKVVQQKLETALAQAVPVLPLTGAFANVRYPHDGQNELELIRHLLGRVQQAKSRAAGANG